MREITDETELALEAVDPVRVRRLERLECDGRAVLAVARFVDVAESSASELAAQLEPLGPDEVQRRALARRPRRASRATCRSRLRSSVGVGRQEPLGDREVAQALLEGLELLAQPCRRARDRLRVVVVIDDLGDLAPSQVAIDPQHQQLLLVGSS